MDFFSPDTAPFAVALCLTLAIAAIEAAGLLLGFGASEAIDSTMPDLHLPDGHVHAEGFELGPLSHALSWLSFGRVPALILLIVFTTSFGLAGFIEQEFFRRSLGFAIDPFIASFPAFLAAIFAMRWGGRLLGRVMPRDQTEAVSTAEFVGRIATVVRGEAQAGRPAEAKLRDIHGKTHYLLVEPEEAGQVFGQGSEVLIVRQQGGVFRAITQLRSA